MKQFEPIFSDDGYRPNVGIIICNSLGKVFWARRVNHDGWQFPQGGMKPDESPLQAMYRELEEETGLAESQVQMVAHTNSWLHYDLPKRYLRNQETGSMFKGQKQVWFLLKLLADDSAINVSSVSMPEFDGWQWVDYWSVLDDIVDFKRPVYKKVLSELEQFMPVI